MGRTMQHGTHLVLALLIAAALPAWAGFLKFEPQTVRRVISLGFFTHHQNLDIKN